MADNSTAGPPAKVETKDGAETTSMSCTRVIEDIEGETTHRRTM